MPRSISKVFYIAAIALLLAIVIFCTFYLFASHDHLAHWFIGLNGCFYKQQDWATDFFTPGIKSDGNMYSLIGIAISLAGILYLARRLKTPTSPNTFFEKTQRNKDILPMALCVVAAIVLWQWGNRQALPAYDEVFSAQNSAGINPFQCIAYYMLPNNHLLFNLINNIIFHFAADKVITGRLISLAVYCGFIVLVYRCFFSLFQSRALAVLAGIAIALQFFTWGFSFQARGYELYLLAEGGLFISLFAYIRTSQKRWLYVNAACIVVGYFCMPSFLYFHGGQILFMLVYMLIYRRAQGMFWKYQLVGLLVTYLCYLPALCFSGLEAIIHNNYVAPMNYKTAGPFCQWLFPYFQVFYIDHMFSNVRWGSQTLNTLFFVLPVLSLFHFKNKTARLFGLFYLCLWLVFFAIVIAMKRPPFERNLIGHYSMSLAGIILLAFGLSELIKIRNIHLGKWVLLPAVLIFFIGHFVIRNGEFLKDTMYEYDVAKSYNDISAGLRHMRPGSTVSFTDEAFYCRYLCNKMGYKTYTCGIGNTEYLVKMPLEQLPPGAANKYASVEKGFEYEICKRVSQNTTADSAVIR